MTCTRLLPLLLLPLLLSGCAGDGRKPIYPVQGTVTYQGAALQGAQVIFYKDGDDKELGTRPHGKTDQQGRFQLTTYVTGDGAPEGNYKVLIVGGRTNKQPAKTPDVPEGGEEREKPLNADTLAGLDQYADPARTKLSADVAKQGNDFRFAIP